MYFVQFCEFKNIKKHIKQRFGVRMCTVVTVDRMCTVVTVDRMCTVVTVDRMCTVVTVDPRLTPILVGSEK
jgi:hypothetical protein